MKNTISFILLIALISSCGAAKISKEKFEPQADKLLIGKWKQVEPIIAAVDYIVEFDEQYYTFHFKEIDPVKDSYHIYKNVIIGPEIELVNHRDSINFEFLHKDTLVLDIKEKGNSLKVKHYRLKD